MNNILADRELAELIDELDKASEALEYFDDVKLTGGNLDEHTNRKRVASH